MREVLKIWKYSLGSFSDDKTEPYDNYVVLIRSIIFVSYLITNCFIISGVIRHWNEVPSYLSTTEKERICNTEGNILQD